MNDPYKKVFDGIAESINTAYNMIIWVAKHTLSAQEFEEFTKEFGGKREK